MSTVIAFLGSPRKNGASTQLVIKAIEGAKAAGAEVVIYDMNDDEIKGCQCCYYCRAHEGCATKDKLQPMYEQIKEADGIIASFPIFFHNINSQGKKLIDRLYPVIDGRFAPRYPGKKVITVYSQANPKAELFQKAIAKNDSFFQSFGWEITENLLAYGTGTPGYEVPQELLDKAYEAGKALVSQ